MRCLMFVAVFALCLTTVAEEENIRVFKDLASAKKELFAGKDVKSGWGSHTAARGGNTYFISETRWYDMEGEQVGHSSTISSSKHSGTVAAVPIGDFEVKQTFVYSGKNRDGTSTVLTGKVVSVIVQISTGGVKLPAEHVMQRSVENMVKSGVPLPPATGAKPGRLVSLLTAAKKRFGARIAKPRYDARAGKLLPGLRAPEKRGNDPGREGTGDPSGLRQARRLSDPQGLGGEAGAHEQAVRLQGRAPQLDAGRAGGGPARALRAQYSALEICGDREPDQRLPACHGGQRETLKKWDEFNFGVMFAHIMIVSEEKWLDLDLIRLENISQKNFRSNQYVLSAVMKNRP